MAKNKVGAIQLYYCRDSDNIVINILPRMEGIKKVEVYLPANLYL